MKGVFASVEARVNIYNNNTTIRLNRANMHLTREAITLLDETFFYCRA